MFNVVVRRSLLTLVAASSLARSAGCNGRAAKTSILLTNRTANLFSTTSFFAKKEGRRASKHKTHDLSEVELNEYLSLEDMNDEIIKAIDHLGLTYATQLALRSNVASFENLPVTTSTGRHLLSHIAIITQKPQMVIIDVSINPEFVGDVKSAIDKSGMNVNAQQDGTSIFVPLPKVTKEHRDAMAKSAKTHAEKVKDKIRFVSSKYAKTFKRHASDRGEDFVKSGEETVHKIGKKFEKQVEELMLAKQRELSASQ